MSDRTAGVQGNRGGVYPNRLLLWYILFPAMVFLGSAPGTLWAQPAANPPPGSLSLEDFKRIAMERNLGLKSSEADVSIAQEEVGSRYVEFYPKLKAEANYRRAGNVPRVLLPMGSFSTSPIVFPPRDSQITTGDLANYALRLTLEQPVFTGGSVYYSYKNAKLMSALAGLQHQENVQDLLLSVELAYWNILKTQQLLEVAKQQVRDLKEHLRVVKASYDAGSVPYNEVLKTTVTQAEAEQRLLTAQNNADLAKMMMNNLLRQELTTTLTPASNGEEKASTELISYEEAVKIARDRRPELAAGRTRVETMKAKRELARSGYYPSVSALATYDHAKETVSVLRENWEVMGVMRWTFWEWGKTAHDVERAQTQVRQSEINFHALEDRIVLEVRQEYLGAVDAREKIAVARTAVEQAKENYRITEERFKAGVTTNTEVLDAESLLISAEANLTNAIYDFQSAKARLDRALGRQVLSADAGKEDNP